MPMQPIGGPLQFDQGPLGAPLQMPAPAPKKKGGMFGSGVGVGEALAAALSGWLAGGGNPVGMANMQMMAHQRQQRSEQERAEQQYQQRRGDSFEDWVKQQAYKQANPDPSNPHYFESNSGDVFSVMPGQDPQEVFHDPFRFKLVPNGMGGVVPVDIGSLMGGQAPTSPVGKLTPIDEGGPTPQASGGFPRSY